MKIPISIAKKLQLLIDGNTLPASGLQNQVIKKMLEDGAVQKQQYSKTKALLFVADKQKFAIYLHNHFGIRGIQEYITKQTSEETLTRADAVTIAGDSKLQRIRSFKGFLVTSYNTVEATINDQPFTIYPQSGSYTFIHDYESFLLPESITIVGIENPENFRFIEQQRYLFTSKNPLFVSRYPQSNDLIKWLEAIPNHYLHFGDLDFAGINIYLNEYKKHLSNKATFFIPPNAEELLQQFGNRSLYDKQYHLQLNRIEEKAMNDLVQLLHKYRKVLEQEIFITPTN